MILERLGTMTTRINGRAADSALEAPGSDAARASGGDLVVVESCTTTWAFDVGRSRFARMPRGVPLTSISAEWRPYSELTLDLTAGTLEVALDQAGTRLLRSQIHTDEACPTCGEV